MAESDDVDFAWLPSDVQSIQNLARRFGFRWTFRLNPPATMAMIESAEAMLGTTLSAGIRAFYSLHNGFRFDMKDEERIYGTGAIAIFEIDRLYDETLRSQKMMLDTYEQTIDEYVTIGQFDYERILVDTSTSVGGEYPINISSHDMGVSDFSEQFPRQTFNSWLRSFMTSITEAKLHPLLGLDLSISSPDPDYYHDEGNRALAACNHGRARLCFTVAMSRRLGDNEGFERDLAALRRMNPTDDAQRFLVRILERLFEARRIAFKRGEGAGQGISIRHDANVSARSPSLEILPLFLSTFAVLISNILMFSGSRFPPPYSDQHANVSIYLGPMSETQQERKNAISQSVIARYGKDFLMVGHAGAFIVVFDAIFLNITSFEIFAASYRPLGPDGEPILTAFRLIGRNLDEVLDAMLIRYREGDSPAAYD